MEAAEAVAAAVDEPSVRVWRTRDLHWSVSAPSPLLDGNIPLRAAQSCVPFVEGNGAGLSLRPPRPLVFARAGRRWVARDPAISLVESKGTLVATVDTGVHIEPVGGALVIERSFNRADRRVSVREQRIDARTALTLALELEIDPSADEIVLDGPLASAMLLPRAVRWGRADPRCASAMVDRHRSFFDRGYFEEKREGATRRYRDRAREPLASLVDGASMDVAVHSLTAAAGLVADALLIRAECAFRAENYGSITRCTVDPAAIEQRAQWLAGELGLASDDPALLYFAHYAMAHTNGDPRVLVKPSVLVATREDWCVLVDGPRSESLRGVSESAWFHAVPIVLDVRSRLAHKAGAPLGRVRALPRTMVRPRIELSER